MNIHLRLDQVTGEHTHFTVFVSGANCGTLCMRSNEFQQFKALLFAGAQNNFDHHVRVSGENTDRG